MSKAFIFLLLIGFQGFFNFELVKLDTVWTNPPLEFQLKRNSEIFKTLSFGYLPAVIDWVLVRIFIDSVYIHPPGSGRSQASFDLDLITDLDPIFFEAYSEGGRYLSIVSKEADSARDLLQKGFQVMKETLPSFDPQFRDQYWGRRWNIPMLIGYVELFQKGNMAQASVALREAGQLPNAPEYLKHLNKRLSLPGGEYEVALKLLDFMILQADESNDEERSDKLERDKVNLLVGQYVFTANYDFSEFLKNRFVKNKGTKSPKKNWINFLSASGRPDRDPWGGALSVNDAGQVVTSTKHEIVLNLN